MLSTVYFILSFTSSIWENVLPIFSVWTDAISLTELIASTTTSLALLLCCILIDKFDDACVTLIALSRTALIVKFSDFFIFINVFSKVLISSLEDAISSLAELYSYTRFPLAISSAMAFNLSIFLLILLENLTE